MRYMVEQGQTTGSRQKTSLSGFSRARRGTRLISGEKGNLEAGGRWPADMLGRTTFWGGWERMSADSAMKWTPQKTMNSACGCWAAHWASLEEPPPRAATRVGA